MSRHGEKTIEQSVRLRERLEVAIEGVLKGVRTPVLRALLESYDYEPPWISSLLREAIQGQIALNETGKLKQKR